MIEIIRKYGVPNKLVDAIDQLYKDTYASVLSPDGLTEQFEIKAGVLQGDTLAPYLFALVVDYAMREAIPCDEEKLEFKIHPRKSRRHPAITVTNMMFSDDIALLSNEIAQAQELFSRVDSEAAQIDLHLNAMKTEVMTFNYQDPVEVFTLNGSKVKIVINFN